MGGVIGPGYQEGIRRVLHNRDKKEDAQNVRDPLWHLLVSTCPVIKVSRKLEKPNQAERLMA